MQTVYLAIPLVCLLAAPAVAQEVEVGDDRGRKHHQAQSRGQLRRAPPAAGIEAAAGSRRPEHLEHDHRGECDRLCLH